MSSDQQIVPGIMITPAGQATVDPALTNLLFDLAIQLEEPTALPVDVQHVVAAIVLATRQGELDRNRPLSPHDHQLAKILTAHVKTVFAKYGEDVGGDD